MLNCIRCGPNRAVRHGVVLPTYGLSFQQIRQRRMLKAFLAIELYLRFEFGKGWLVSIRATGCAWGRQTSRSRRSVSALVIGLGMPAT